MKKFEKVSDAAEVDFFEITMDAEGNKEIHIIGYTYYGDDWQYMDVCGCTMPLAEFIEGMKEHEDFAANFMAEGKQYQYDRTEEEIVEDINGYFNGNPADYYLDYEEITMETPCGHYVHQIEKN